MTTSPIPDAAVEAYIATMATSFGYSTDPDGSYMRMWREPSSFERVRAGLAAVYPLLRAQVREEVARDIEAAPDAILPPSSVDRSRVAAIARGVAADGAETEFIGGAA